MDFLQSVDNRPTVLYVCQNVENMEYCFQFTNSNWLKCVFTMVNREKLDDIRYAGKDIPSLFRMAFSFFLLANTVLRSLLLAKRTSGDTR